MCKNTRIYILEQYGTKSTIVYVITDFGTSIEVAKELSLELPNIMFYVSEAVLNDFENTPKYLASVMNGQMTIL